MNITISGPYAAIAATFRAIADSVESEGTTTILIDANEEGGLPLQLDVEGDDSDSIVWEQV